MTVVMGPCLRHPRNSCIHHERQAIGSAMRTRHSNAGVHNPNADTEMERSRCRDKRHCQTLRRNCIGHSVAKENPAIEIQLDDCSKELAT
jgi:hypothetical protein